jgi:hypothetical protein
MTPGHGASGRPNEEARTSAADAAASNTLESIGGLRWVAAS